MDLLHTASGFLVGTLVGLTGVGGGALMTPILVLLLGVAPTTAVGTDLWFAAITKTVGGGFHHRSETVDWDVVKRLAWGSIPAAILTILFMHYSHMGKLSGGNVTKILGFALVLSAIASLGKSYFHHIGRRLRIQTPEQFKHLQPILTTVAGVVLGILVTLTSVGAGSLCAVILLYLYPIRMTPTKLVGTDIVHAIPLTIVAGIGYLWMGEVDLKLLLSLLVGSIPGVLVGSFFATRVNTTVLRLLISTMLVSVGIKLLV